LGKNEGEREPRDALAELIEVEHRVEREVEAARTQADHIIAAARREAESRVGEANASIEAALVALRAAVERECDASIRSLEADAAAQLERYRGVDSVTLRRLAQWLVAQVTGAPQGTPPS
jgi:F0F1-type ATP synthase membrane subunit b/b'